MNYTRHDVTLTDKGDHLVVASRRPLPPVADNTGVWLRDWADKAPGRVFLAERSGKGWREMTYGETLDRVRAMAGGLIARGLGAGSRVMVVSGNGIDHGLLMLAAQYIGAAIVPVAEQYSLIPEALPRLLSIAERIKPDLVYADDGNRYGAALGHFEKDTVVVGGGGGFTGLDSLLAAGEDGVDEAHRGVAPETVAKILMTSGSTSQPKAVPTTHRMLTSNQAQILDSLPFLGDPPPVLVDWLPWNHVFGGSHNFNLVLANGGSLYIDDGKPMPGLFERTVENLGLKAGTASFNVPVGFAMLLETLRKDEGFARFFFADLAMLFYAGASLPRETREGLEGIALKHRDNAPLVTSSWGLTETAPACLMQMRPTGEIGAVGVPMPAVEMKLVPEEEGGRYEVRVRGPNIFGGYLDAAELNAETFDEEGYFKTGDAMSFVDAKDACKGMRFEGRISEEFKLLTGTWVRAGSLRLELLGVLEGLARDLVVTGADRDDIGLMIFPAEGASAEAVRAALVERAAGARSSSTHIARAMLMEEPASIAEGEITAKGNLNFRRILERRRADLERLYGGGEGIITIAREP